ncbi:MAG: hypothetical protein KAG56_09680, partial [Sulfurovaceae bacterium]|nr:hypothetical protein [Sulfurovaceae bacterium]
EDNHLPTVKITSGDQVVNQGDSVNLSATAIDLDGDSLTYLWTIKSKPNGSDAQINNSRRKSASFVADESGNYVIAFKANDGLSDSNIKTTRIRVSSDDPTPTPTPPPSLTEDCISHNLSKVKVIRDGSNWTITDDSSLMFSFQDKDEADRALEIIKHYKMDKTCYVGRPQPSLTYLLVDNKSPKNGIADEDCVGFNLNNIEVKEINNRYKIVDGSHYIFDFEDKKDEADKSLEIIKKYGFNQSCYVGLPDPDFSYLRKGGDKRSACGSYIELPQYVEEDRILDGCYKVTSSGLTVTNNALLTINAGSTLMFVEDAQFTIEKDGALKAKGTDEETILFTGEQKTAGYWKNIRFRGSDDSRNEIAHTTIEYAGSDGALHLKGSYGGDNRLKLSNIVIKHSSSHGFNFEAGSKFDKFENITSTKNAKTAGVVDMSVLDKMDRASNFTGNLGDDYITVKNGNVPTNATWHKLTVPILIQSDIHLSDNATLTLEAGVHLVFDSGNKLSTGGLGVLNAVGTADKPILFTGKKQEAGYWLGIIIGSDSTNNILKNTIVEYAGEDSSGAI